MRLRRKLLDKAEEELQELIERARKQLIELVGDEDMAIMVARIVSSDRTGHLKLVLRRRLADRIESQLEKLYNDQQELL